MKVLFGKLTSVSTLRYTTIALIISGLCISACAKGDVTPSEIKAENSAKTVKIAATTVNKDAGPPLTFTGTISGMPLDVSPQVKGEVYTDQVKQFLATGDNPYSGDSTAIKQGLTVFLTACSGCHGHLAEGKLGPALADDYWTYPKNATDKGLFETIYGGANGMMGPQQGHLKVDEILHIIAWIRHQAEEVAKGGGSAAH